MGYNVNCIHYDQGSCLKKPRFLKFFKPACMERFEKCELRKEYPRSKPPGASGVPPPPKVKTLASASVSELEEEIEKKLEAKSW